MRSCHACHLLCMVAVTKTFHKATTKHDSVSLQLFCNLPVFRIPVFVSLLLSRWPRTASIASTFSRRRSCHLTLSRFLPRLIVLWWLLAHLHPPPPPTRFHLPPPVPRLWFSSRSDVFVRVPGLTSVTADYPLMPPLSRVIRPPPFGKFVGF